MREIFEQHKPKILIALAVFVLLVAGYMWYDNSQTKEYVQSVQYDVQALTQSYTTLTGYEKGGMTFISFFENTEKVQKDIAKAKEGLMRSNPKNTTSHAIKKAALDYADGVSKMLDEANSWRKYEMLNKGNKAGIDKVQQGYYEVKNQTTARWNTYLQAVK